MIKKIVLGSLLVLSASTSFAGNGECGSDIVGLDINTDSSVKELKEYKKELEATKDRVDYIYYYTLTHNRIIIKSEKMKYNSALQKLKSTYAADPKKVDLITSREADLYTSLDMALENINIKTEDSKNQKLLEIDDQINYVNELISERPLIERLGF
jgi:hypothetical protein